jgi:hypothetical protein
LYLGKKDLARINEKSLDDKKHEKHSYEQKKSGKIFRRRIKGGKKGNSKKGNRK